MSEEYEVLWAATAEDDLANIVDYVANDSPANALKILQRIKEATMQLCHSPERGRIVPELQDQGILQYRELIVPLGGSCTEQRRRMYSSYPCSIHEET